MNRKPGFHFKHIFLTSMVAYVLCSCNPTALPIIPITLSQTVLPPTSDDSPANVPSYTHYYPSETFKIRLEFDYPNEWLLEEDHNNGLPNIFLKDPRFFTLAPPSDDMHPVPNDFGIIDIWILPPLGEITAESEMESLKQAYSTREPTAIVISLIRDYKTTIDEHEAYVLEYQLDDFETSPSLMFVRRIFFDVNNDVYEIVFSVSQNERQGEFEQGYEYFINSLKILE